MKQREAHRFNNNWAYAKKIWKYKVNEFGLEGWQLRTEAMIDKIGLCDPNIRTITLSSVFMQGANCNYAKVKKALLHEIAHALTPGHGHNKVWRGVCGKIGGDTRLAGSMDLPGRNWSLYCRVCKWRQEYISRPDITNKICGKCGYQPRVRYIN